MPVPLIAVILALPPLCTDMHLSAYQAMRLDFGVDPAVIQATFTTFIIGFAIGQLIVGPFSDSAGRRWYLIGGGVAFAVASLATALAPDPTTLLVTRAIQGVAGAAMVVAARAAVTDLTTDVGTARSFASIASLTALAPVIAPVLGTAISTATSWRWIFATQAVIGLIVVGMALARLPETLDPDRRTPLRVRSALLQMKFLLHRERFAWHVAAGSAAGIGFYTYINASSFIVQGQFGATPVTFATMFTVNALGMVGVITLVRIMVRRIDVAKIFGFGLGICLAGAAALGVLSVLGLATLPAVWVCFAIVSAGWGCVIPTNLAIAQIEGRRYAATAAALQGGIQFGLGGLATPLSGLLGATVSVTVGIMLVSFVAGVGLYFVGRARSNRGQAALG